MTFPYRLQMISHVLQDVIADKDIVSRIVGVDGCNVDDRIGIAPLDDVAADVTRLVLQPTIQRPFRRKVQNSFSRQIEAGNL
jgi:hypothetical protein